MILQNFDYVEIANNYAQSVVDGDIEACKSHRQACQRHLDDMVNLYYVDFDEDEHGDFIEIKIPMSLDEAKANRVCAFIEKLPHVKGEKAKAGECLFLEPWQIFIVCSIFGWVHDDGTRRYDHAYIKIPRKNGKTTLVAAIGIYMLCADDEHAAEIYCGATSRDQALEVFAPAKKMCEKTPDLIDRFGIDINKNSLYIEDLMSKFVPLIGDPGDGANPSCSITDEYHEHKTADQFNTMSSGMGNREQPLALVITTAGADISGPCYDMEQAGKDCLEGTIINGQLFVMIFGIDDGDKWDSLESMRKANPNIGVSVKERYLKNKLRDARSRPSLQALYKTKHLNRWVSAMNAYFDLETWKACGVDGLDMEDYKGRKCYVALDLATTVDPAAMIILFPPDGDKKDWGVFVRFYVPENTLKKTENKKWKVWASNGHMIETPGNAIDYDYIEEDLDDICANFKPVDVAYDKFQATMLAGHMVKKGIDMVEYNHTVGNMSEPMKFVEALILKRLIRHDNNPVMNWMMGNVVAFVDRKENVYPNKNKPHQKIDGPVCLIMGVGRSIVEDEDDEDSVYNERGITII